MPTCSTEAVIDQLIEAVYGGGADARQRHVLNQALQGLVRQARMEQLQAMRRDMARATGTYRSERDLTVRPEPPHDAGRHAR